ncbi:hypothetical protein GCM10010274_02440 [Streptomyces lavendofoliae]|uniref:Uncharacterized protein n=1 Tax=Streptomyces lavendofoliae TaxID=67314 RepID=A0A918HTA5_9ACTN|nr:hypothetical protein GCM10010274_02440 [Streptomyces lavendofoliae]
MRHARGEGCGGEAARWAWGRAAGVGDVPHAAVPGGRGVRSGEGDGDGDTQLTGARAHGRTGARAERGAGPVAG